MSEPSPMLRLLAVEDSAMDARLLQELLHEAGPSRTAVTHVRTLEAAAEALAHSTFDCVLLDLGLPDGDGLGNVERIRAGTRDAAIVVLTGRDDDRTALEALRRGAQEYAVKGAHDGEELLRIVHHAVERHRLMAALSSEREQEYYRATHDALTGLPNRQLFVDRAAMALTRAERTGSNLAVCFLDLDGFKPVNDRHGHAVGDALLREVAQVLRDTLREGDTVARVGGDEFVVLMAAVPDQAEAEMIARRLIARVGAIRRVGDVPVTIGTSAGIALYPDHGDNLQQLLINADLAMYQAKRGGRGTLRVYGPPSPNGNFATPGGGINESALTLSFQPWVRHDGRFAGIEAYVRPAGGGSAAEIIAQASQHAWLDALGRWVMVEACRRWLDLKARGLQPPPLSVNVAGAELDSDHFAKSRIAILESCAMPYGSVSIEVPERAFDGDGHPARVEQLRRLREHGVRVYLDNFGRESASLRRISRLPLSGVKLDPVILHDMRDGGARARIVATSAAELARALGFEVIATGVETEADLANAQILLPHGLQGTRLAPPVAPDQLGALMAGPGAGRPES